MGDNAKLHKHILQASSILFLEYTGHFDDCAASDVDAKNDRNVKWAYNLLWKQGLEEVDDGRPQSTGAQTKRNNLLVVFASLLMTPNLNQAKHVIRSRMSSGRPASSASSRACFSAGSSCSFSNSARRCKAKSA